MTSISYINLHFRAPSLLKPLKSSPRYQNLPGESVTALSDPKNDRKRPKSTKKRPNKRPMLTYARRRCLTRDSRNRRLTRDSRIPDFFRKKSGKIVNIGFLDSRDQNKIDFDNFNDFFI